MQEKNKRAAQPADKQESHEQTEQDLAAVAEQTDKAPEQPAAQDSPQPSSEQGLSAAASEMPGGPGGAAEEMPAEEEEREPPSYDELRLALAKAIADARLASGRSIEDIAYQINIPVPTLTKMENGSAFETMEKVFLRGYLINYAKALELEQEPLLELLTNVYLAKDGNAAAAPKANKQRHQLNEYSVHDLEGGGNNRLFTFLLPIGITVIVLGALIYWRFVMSEQPAVTPAALEELQSSIPAYVEEESAESADIAAPAAPPSNEVSFTFSADSWLEVTDQSDNEMAWQLYRSGESASFSGTPPYTVVVGNARATLVRYRGETLDLSDYTESDNVARFTVPLGAAR